MAEGPDAPWLGRFVDLLPISSEGRFRLTSARDLRTGRECVVVTAAADASPELAESALDRFHRAHRRIEHPIVARALDAERDGAYVALDCAARTDLAGLLMIARARDGKIEHSAADGFITTLRDAMFHAIAIVDGEHPSGYALGSISHGSVLFAADGRFWLLGYGHNVAVLDERGRMGGRSTAFQAPEVSVGVTPTRSSEYVGLLLFMRSLVPFVRLRPGLVRILAENTFAEDFELVRRLVWFERHIYSALPGARASVEEAIGVSERIRALLGVHPDVDDFRRAVHGILVAHGRFGSAPGAERWRVTSDGSRIERVAGAVDVPGRGPMRRLVLALARARLERPGATLTVGELLAEGWPGERVLARAGRNRVHVAISTLRRLGLGTDIESSASAYRLSPAVVVELVEPAPPGWVTAPATR